MSRSGETTACFRVNIQSEPKLYGNRMTTDLHARFSALHHSDQPLLLANAWDAASARLLEDAGAPAIGTSSAAVAWARGYPDGNALPRAELISAIRNMARVLSAPLTADIEGGYSDSPETVAELAAEVVEAGAAGINIEDGTSDPALLVDKIRAIRSALGPAPLFINARTDVYLAGLETDGAAAAATVERLKHYEAAGADGAFVPGLADAGEMTVIAGASALPLNVMVVPGLPPIDRLRAAGVRRISLGPALFVTAYTRASAAARAFLGGEMAPLFPQDALEYAAMNLLFEDPTAP